MTQTPQPPWPWIPSPWWAGRIWALNFDPLSFAHPEHWRAHVHPDLARQLVGEPRVRGRFLRWLCAQLELAKEHCFDFSAPARRFALLETADIQRIVRLATLVLCAPALRRFVRPGDRAILQTQLGQDDLHFIFHRASLHHWPAELPLPKIEPERLEEGVRETSARVLAAIMHGYPEPLARRLRMRFPSAELAGPPAGEISPAERAAMWALAGSVAVREINPELHPCFV